ncbi:MAG: hypothetical protein AAFR28_11750 [Pseudomonadota bacterium]
MRIVGTVSGGVQICGAVAPPTLHAFRRGAAAGTFSRLGGRGLNASDETAQKSSEPASETPQGASVLHSRFCLLDGHPRSHRAV